MTISSRTPEGEPNRCPVCRHQLTIEPSRPPGDAPCPRCGVLLWFAGDRVERARVSREVFVRAIKGVFANMHGRVCAIDERHQLARIEFTVLGRPVSVELEFTHLEIVP
jgi:hypothetical protein